MKDSTTTTTTPFRGQLVTFANGWIDITPKGIEDHLAWSDTMGFGKISFSRFFRRRPIFKTVEKSTDSLYNISLTEAGEKCEFYKFVVRTCCSRGEPTSGPDAQYLQDLRSVPIMARLTAIGYLLHNDQRGKKYAIVAANNCSRDNFTIDCGGKTLFGFALGFIAPQRSFPNWASFKSTPEARELFRYRTLHLHEVSPNTFFLRDVLKATTEGFRFTPRGAQAYIVDPWRLPKVYATAQDVLNIPSREMRERIKILAFWDYYNPNYGVRQDFGHLLFEDWNQEQWCLFENFMYECVWLYLKSVAEGWAPDGSGIVDDPTLNVSDFYRAHNHPKAKAPGRFKI